jgi:tetratricopeptide (TPR) repeat protein
MVKLLTALEQSKDYREENREWTSISSQERSKNEKYVKLIGEIFYSGSIPDTATLWWKGEIGSLTMLKEKGNPRKSVMASRLLNFISIVCSEQGTALYRQKRYDLSGFFFEICTWSDNENMYNYYNLARSLSGSDKKREAIEALNKAVEHGFTSRKTVQLDPVFIPIRNEEKFKSLLMKMK